MHDVGNPLPLVNKGVLDDLFQGRPKRWIYVENLFDQVLNIFGQVDLLREVVQALLDFFISHFYLGGFKGGPPDAQRIDHDPQGPNVNFVAVALLVVQNLGGQIIWGPADRVPLLLVILQLSRQPIVPQFNFQLLV